MTAAGSFQFVTVGTTPELIHNLWDPIAAGSAFRFSHIVHPRFCRKSWPEGSSGSKKYFFSDELQVRLPAPDRKFLLSLEREGVPTVHNMILGDRVVAALPYEDALGYATLIGKRLTELLEQIKPAAVIGGFDAIHGSMALAVARKMGVPWYALHFSVIPQGLACFCDKVSPDARVLLEAVPFAQTQALATNSLHQFESREIVAPAYIAPTPRSISEHFTSLLGRMSTVFRMLSGEHFRELSRYTDPASRHDIPSAIKYLRHSARARRAVARNSMLGSPPPNPYVLFGLHMQPESSIDVWAPFFSNQMWVIELLSRSIPPTHRLLVKIHKSDTARYSGAELRKMASYPGVKLVAPRADTRRLIENADLIVLIQGTIGLEAALLGKPVIMLGQSPFALFPSVTQNTEITALPALIKQKLNERRPSRNEILASYCEYLRPFAPASTNDWTVSREAAEICDYRRLFDRLSEYVMRMHRCRENL